MQLMAAIKLVYLLPDFLNGFLFFCCLTLHAVSIKKFIFVLPLVPAHQGLSKIF